jgi:hypothetical protein
LSYDYGNTFREGAEMGIPQTIGPPQECPGNGYDELLFRGNLWSRNSFAWIGCGM